MAEVVNAKMRKAIKILAVTCQTARFISLMPQPKDFITRITGDVVLLSSEVTKLTENMNRVLDGYTNIPTDYLTTQLNSMTDSLVRISNNMNIYNKNILTQISDLKENGEQIFDAITNSLDDIIKGTSKAVKESGDMVSTTKQKVLANPKVASYLKNNSSTILNWTDNGFETADPNIVSQTLQDAKNAMGDAKNGLQNAKNAIEDVNNKINDQFNKANNFINDKSQKLAELITWLKEQMDKLSSDMDTQFRDVTGMSVMGKNISKVNEAIKDSDLNSPSAQIAGAVTEGMANAINAFSIGKVVMAFGGVMTQTLIVKMGLDQLPPIDFESMLNKIRDDAAKTEEALYGELNALIADSENELSDLARIKADNKEYMDNRYKDFIAQFTENIQKQRDDIRLAMKNMSKDPKISKAQETLLRAKTKSAIKEVRKFKKQVKKAKGTNTFKNILNDELKAFKSRVQSQCNTIKSDWDDMMEQYKDAIAEIREFWMSTFPKKKKKKEGEEGEEGDNTQEPQKNEDNATSNGGDRYINDLCADINKRCDDIVELCTSIGTQLVACNLKAGVPSDVGPVAPNPSYKLADFWMDVKTIFKFIMDLINAVLGIINDINKLAQILLNGFNSLKDIIKQIFELLKLQWLIDLIQGIIDNFGEKITDAKILIENMISPVYYKDTEEYENTLEAIESMVTEDGELDTTYTDELKALADNKFHKITFAYKKIYEFDHFGGILGFHYDKNHIEMDDDGFEKLLLEIEEKEDDIVAYRSPILEDDINTDGISVDSLMKGLQSLNSTVKFKGWIYYHPNLDHKNYSKRYKKKKNRVIKKASKTYNKKNGGVLGMKNRKRWRVKSTSAYDAFYWYTYYTEDLEKDCYMGDASDNQEYIDRTINTENGTIVELSDGRKVFVANNRVRSGDYVNVNGQRYRVK